MWRACLFLVVRLMLMLLEPTHPPSGMATLSLASPGDELWWFLSLKPYGRQHSVDSLLITLGLFVLYSALFAPSQQNHMS